MMGEILKKVLQGAAGAVGGFFRGTPDKSGSVKDAEKRITDPAAKKKLDEYNKALEKKNKLELDYYKTASAIVGLEELKAKGKNVDGELKTENEVLKRRKEAVEVQLKEMQQYKDFAQEQKFYEDSNFRRRKAQEMYFRQGETGQTSFFGSDLPGMRSFEINKDKLGKYKDGGPIKVPGTGSGDKMFTMVQPGSFVMNRNAAGFQTGGVPVMLEPGEHVYAPGQWGPSEMMMNSLIPRFQKGGEIPGTEASGAREGVTPSEVRSGTKGKDVVKEQQASNDSTGQKGAAAIIKAAEASTGIYRGVREMCAVSTRAVLKSAGHPGAEKITTTANLDSPKGYGPSKQNRALAGSFAGSDLGKVYTPAAGAPAGSVIMWRGTYGVDKWGPDAVTHVGIKGKGDTIYHHGSAPGWRKDRYGSLSSKRPFAVDLNGKATGGGGASPEGGPAGDPSGGGGSNFISDILTGAGNAANALGGGMKQGLYSAGLPGLADLMEVVGIAAQETLGPAASLIFSGLSNFGSGFLGGMMNPAQAGQTNTPTQTGNQNFPGMFGPSGGGALDKDLALGGKKNPLTGGGGSSAGAGGSLSQVEKEALNIIGKYESDPVGGYNAVNQIGTKGGRGVKGYSGDIRKMNQHGGKSLTGFTVGQIMDLQNNSGANKRLSDDQWINRGKLHAVGRYQMIGPTFSRIVDSMGISRDQSFTPELQDKMALWLLRNGGGGIKQWVGPADKASQQERNIVRQARMNGKQTGGVVNMKNASSHNMKRFAQAQAMFEKSGGGGGAPIIINQTSGGGGGQGNVNAMNMNGTPAVPNLPDGPNVVAMLELTNRLAIGAAI